MRSAIMVAQAACPPAPIPLRTGSARRYRQVASVAPPMEPQLLLMLARQSPPNSPQPLQPALPAQFQLGSPQHFQPVPRRQARIAPIRLQANR
jgi:hypothetical protein